MTRMPTVPEARTLLPAVATAIIVAATFAPWLLGFSSSHAAVAGHIAFAMGFGPIALLITALSPAAITTMVAGAWLAFSPWTLGYASLGGAAWSVDLIAGLALIALGTLALRSARRRPGSARFGRP